MSLRSLSWLPLAGALLALPVHAEEAATAPAPAPAPAAPEVPAWFQRLSVGALVDAYYSQRILGGASSTALQTLRTTAYRDTFVTNPRANSELRVFDNNNGTFSLAYAKLSLAMAPQPAGFRLDLGFGSVADLASLDFSAADHTVASSPVYKALQQAYVSLTLPFFFPVTLDAGKFNTSAGAEVIEAKDNWTYSRSYLFGYAIPFTHTGLRASVSPLPGLTLQTSLVNGWEMIHDNNDQKTVGFTGIYAAPTGTTFTFNSYLGAEGDNPDNVRTLLEAVVVQDLCGRVGLNLDAVVGYEDNATWYGAAVMGRVVVSDLLRLAMRVEQFSDPAGVRMGYTRHGKAAGLYVSEATFTAGIPVGQNAEIRPELRYDLASERVFGGGESTGQGTVQVGFLGWL